jgi:hypothetical protein
MRSGVPRFWRWSRSTMKSGTLVYDKHNGIILNIHDPWLTVVCLLLFLKTPGTLCNIAVCSVVFCFLFRIQ